MQPVPFFHDPSGAVRFRVAADDGEFVGASVAKATPHFRFEADMGGADAVAVYRVHREEIDAATRPCGAGSAAARSSP